MELGTQLNTFPKLIIKAGTVVSNHSSFNDRLPKTVEFDNGVVWGANEGGTAGNVANSTNFIVPKGKTGTFYGSYSGTHTGTLTGEGTFNAYTGAVRCYWKGDWSAFTGVVYAGKQNRQNKPSYDPVFSYYNNKGLPNATLNVRAEVTVSNTGPKNGDSSFDIPVGAVAGSGTLAGNGTWILGTKNTDFSIGTLTVNGTICIVAVDDNTLQVGDEIRLWSEGTKLAGTPKFDMQGGVTWDTSRISEGVLVVAGIDTGVNPVLADTDPCNVYDLKGRLVRRLPSATSTEGLPAGVYIRGGRKVIVK
jgi:hypothetical protein